MLPLKRPPCSSKPGQAPGFTLLEVMIAVALIAIALVTLIGAQARSVALATGSRFDVVASMLAQGKLTELSRADFEGLTGGSGDFGEAFPHFSWQAEVGEVGESESGIKGSDGLLKTIDVTILLDGDASQTYTARTIVCKKQQDAAGAGQRAGAGGVRPRGGLAR